MLRASLLLLCLVAGSRQLSIEELVVPHEVKVGENVDLQCTYVLSAGERVTSLFYVKWWWTPLDSDGDDRQLIYQRIHGHPAQKMHKDSIEIKPNDSIELVGVTPKDSGSYECEVSNDGEDRRVQRLIVYTEGTGPLLNVTTVEDGPDEDNEDDVVVTCEAFDAAPQPDLVITVDGKEIEPDLKTVSEPAEGYYTIATNATLSRDGVIDGAIIACELFYKDDSIIHEPYKVQQEFQPSGSEGSATEAETAAEGIEATTEALPPNGGAVMQISSLAVLLTAAVLALH